MDVSLFLLWQTLAFVLSRFLLALYRAQCEGDEKGWQSKLDEKLHIAESLLPYCLTAEAVVLFYILFMWCQNKWRTIKLRGINDVESLRFAANQNLFKICVTHLKVTQFIYGNFITICLNCCVKMNVTLYNFISKWIKFRLNVNKKIHLSNKKSRNFEAQNDYFYD